MESYPFRDRKKLVFGRDLTPIEIADGYKLLGRNRRMTPADFAGDRTARSLVDIEDPAVPANVARTDL